MAGTQAPPCCATALPSFRRPPLRWRSSRSSAASRMLRSSVTSPVLLPYQPSSAIHHRPSFRRPRRRASPTHRNIAIVWIGNCVAVVVADKLGGVRWIVDLPLCLPSPSGNQKAGLGLLVYEVGVSTSSPASSSSFRTSILIVLRRHQLAIGRRLQRQRLLQPLRKLRRQQQKRHL